MKSFIVFALFVAAAAAVPVSSDAAAEIVKYVSDNIGVEGFSYNYETDNGIKAEETGQLKNVGTEGAAIVVRGSFSYVGKDNVVYTVTYVADENGFQPSGAHLPQAA